MMFTFADAFRVAVYSVCFRQNNIFGTQTIFVRFVSATLLPLVFNQRCLIYLCFNDTVSLPGSVLSKY